MECQTKVYYIVAVVVLHQLRDHRVIDLHLKDHLLEFKLWPANATLLVGMDREFIQAHEEGEMKDKQGEFSTGMPEQEKGGGT
ncbi:Hypothetical predicted protein [Xyrichtys novacula]|uniref:Uncharacterized protein n=1 Tax=Xyrichtys novacula TaxID=13765 RepID=A0AAV1H705_XYRNO|nr:Hypothetical predicted protein [Xyrichtys novacula]